MARLYALQLADQRAMEKQGVRENPIRRSGYAVQGGASGEVQQLKQAIAQLQDEQQNATPVQRTMNDRAIEHLTEQLDHLEGGAMSGGAHPTQPMEFALASRRAMEEQHSRQNPRRKGATPTMGVSEVRGGSVGDVMWGLVDPFGFHKMGRGGAMTGGMSSAEAQAQREASFARMSPERQASYNADMEKHGVRGIHPKGGAMTGGRAVPSSGLSQFRGGAVIVGAGHGSDSESDEEMEGCGKLTITHGGARDAEIMARESGRRPAIRSGLSDEHSVEAKEMGKHLGKHLMSVRGGKFFDLFTKGIVESGEQNASIAQYTGLPNSNPPSAPPPPSTGGAMFYRQGDMSKDTDEHHEEHAARRFGRTHRGGAYDFSSIMPKKEEQARSMVYTAADRKRDQERAAEGTFEERQRRGFIKKKPSDGMEQRGFKFGDPTESIQRLANDQAKLRQMASRSLLDVPKITAKGGFLSGSYEGMGKLTITHGGTRSKSKPSRKEKNPYGRTHTSELSLGMTKKVKKPAQAPPHEDQPDMGLALDLPPPPPKGKGRRAPAGPSDGRRARAAIVKKVMAEQGFKSMIEASKYVKEHNLYTGGGVGDKRKAEYGSDRLRWDTNEKLYREEKREARKAREEAEEKETEARHRLIIATMRKMDMSANEATKYLKDQGLI
jgi:hypothetical protein